MSWRCYRARCPIRRRRHYYGDDGDETLASEPSAGQEKRRSEVPGARQRRCVRPCPLHRAGPTAQLRHLASRPPPPPPHLRTTATATRRDRMSALSFVCLPRTKTDRQTDRQRQTGKDRQAKTDRQRTLKEGTSAEQAGDGAAEGLDGVPRLVDRVVGRDALRVALRQQHRRRPLEQPPPPPPAPQPPLALVLVLLPRLAWNGPTTWGEGVAPHGFPFAPLLEECVALRQRGRGRGHSFLLLVSRVAPGQ